VDLSSVLVRSKFAGKYQLRPASMVANDARQIARSSIITMTSVSWYNIVIMFQVEGVPEYTVNSLCGVGHESGGNRRVSRLDAMLLLPRPERWRESIEQFSRDVQPLVPEFDHDVRVRAIDFLLWSISGGKVGSDGILQRPLPQPECLAAFLRAVGGDLPAEISFVRSTYGDADRLEVIDYLDRVVHHWSCMSDPPVSSATWRRLCSDNIISIALAHGVRPGATQRFRPVFNSITYIWERSFRFAYFHLPIIAIVLPFIPDDLPTALGRHPRFASGIRALQRITRMGKLIASANPVANESTEQQADSRIDSQESIVVPNNPLVATALEAIWHGGTQAHMQTRGWTDLDRSPTFSRTGRHGGTIKVYLDPAIAPGETHSRHALRSHVEEMSAFTSDVLLAILARLAPHHDGNALRRSFGDPVVISSETILQTKGVDSRKDASWVARLQEEIERLSALRFDVEDYPIWERVAEHRRRRRITWRGDRLFEAVRLEQGDKGRDPHGPSWLVSPGMWARWWFDARERRYVSHLPRRLLTLDHRRTRGRSVMSKKIGEKVLFLYSISRSSKPLEFTVEQLLSMIGELPRPECRGRHWAGRVRERFDDAMLDLEHTDVFTSVTWPDGFGPGDPDRYRGWVDRWLAARVCVQPAPHPSPFPNERKRGHITTNTDQVMYAVKNLRSIRTRLGWTQKWLAERLGISPSLLSKIENHRAVPNAELLEKLAKWLSEHSQAARKESGAKRASGIRAKP